MTTNQRIPLPTDPIIFGNANGVHPVTFNFYPDGQPVVMWGAVKDIVERHARPVSRQRMLVRTTKMDEFCAAMFLVDAMVERGLPVPELILPCFPGSRQDRLNPEGDFLFTVKSVASLVNPRNFPSVTVLDPHSEVTPALIDRCRVVHADEILRVGLTGLRNPHVVPSHEYEGVIAPDAGALKRATGVAQMLGVPLYHAWKKRNISDSGLSGFGCEELPVTDGKFLIVDDLCDGGGTFNGLREIDALGDVRFDLYVTHGLFTQGLAALGDSFEQIITTDSVPQTQFGSKLTVLSTCQDLLERKAPIQ